MPEWITLAGIVAILAFPWRIYNVLGGRIAGLEQRVSRVEGLMEGVRDVVAGRSPAP